MCSNCTTADKVLARRCTKFYELPRDVFSVGVSLGSGSQSLLESNITSGRFIHGEHSILDSPGLLWRDSLPRRTDNRHEPHPLAVIWHRDQFLCMSTPVDEASYAKERPADLAGRLVAVSADRYLAARTPAADRVALAHAGRPLRSRSVTC